MKKLLFISVFLMCSNSFAMPVDVHGYLRSGVGNAGNGEKASCFNNPGSEGNEFRLGNECGTYGETTFALDFLEKNQANTSFKVQSTFAFFPNNNTQYGDESSTNDIDVVETFFESNKLPEVPYRLWVGKRFYRDVDVHMNDFYYFAAMNGVGAGVSDINLFNANLKLAYLQETTKSTTNNEQVVKSFFDIRLFDLKTNSFGDLNFWSAIGNTSSGRVGSTNYEKLNGFLFGLRLRNSLESGFNDFAVIYGNKLLSSLSVYGNSETGTGIDNSGKYKFRVVEHITTKISPKFELHASSTIEQRNNGRTDSLWWNIGSRPTYFINDNLRFVTEVGHSEVIDSTKTLSLTRLTFAYEVSINQSIWARPVIRAFVTKSLWNKDNRVNFNNKKDGHAIGFQGEAWF